MNHNIGEKDRRKKEKSSVVEIKLIVRYVTTPPRCSRRKNLRNANTLRRVYVGNASLRNFARNVPRRKIARNYAQFTFAQLTFQQLVVNFSTHLIRQATNYR